MFPTYGSNQGSPTLAGRFFTAEPPGKPKDFILFPNHVFVFGTHVSPSYSETYWKVRIFFSFQVTGRSHLCSKTGIWNHGCCSAGLLTKDCLSWQSWEQHPPNKSGLHLVFMLSFWSPLFTVSYTMFSSSHFINDSFIYSSIKCLLSN